MARGLFAGALDVLTEDVSAFWGWLNGSRGRKAVYADQEIRIWLPECYRL
jgi:hypothetical protein